MRGLRLPSGAELPVLGQGTWRMGEDASRRASEVAALRHGLDLGLGLIDTAEMYADAEEVVGEAIEGRRDEVFLVSKVLPSNSSYAGTIEACERSLRRTRTDHLDLFLLHWRGGIPLSDTVSALIELREAGKIRDFGVSNLDTDDMRELWEVEGARDCATDQILFNLTRRGPEHDLLPRCREHGVPVMAYSPIEQGRLLQDPVLAEVAERHGATPAQIAIAWVLAGEDLCAIPKASRPEHVEQNRAALDITLTDADLATLDERFPAPDRAIPLEVL